MTELSDLFKLVAQEKKKKKDEIDSLIGDSFEKLFIEQLKPFKTPEQIAKKHDVPVSKIKNQLKKGIKVEKEHTKDEEIASVIASQHLDELPDYYDRLAKVETKPVKEEKLVSEGLLNNSSQEKTKDPLTPLDQNFATLEDLQKHYKLFLNRIQQQLSTLGGGGETNLTYMDVPITSVTTSTYTIKHQDYYIGVNYAGAVTITLPRADREGKIFVVKDELGEASKGTNRYITILPSATDLIDGRDRAIIAYDYGSLTLIWKGNSWRVI
jgi:transcriptional regulator of heat shock response